MLARNSDFARLRRSAAFLASTIANFSWMCCMYCLWMIPAWTSAKIRYQEKTAAAV